ncbi:MAG: SET domain-containing protein-lysine N-methyltransferase [Candidatus Moraniibacteriota bacterium]
MTVIKHDRPTNVSVKRSSAGLGLFAAVPLKKRETIIEYIGRRIASKDGDELENNSYVFTVNSRVDIDGSPRYNTARYANHSCRPNCESVIRKSRVFIVAIKDIEPGEELTYDYGKEYFNYFIKPAGCKCVKCRAKKIARPVPKKSSKSRA